MDAPRGRAIPAATAAERAVVGHADLSPDPQRADSPVYAGAYAFGKTCRERYVDEHGNARQRMRRLPQAEWDVLICDPTPASSTSRRSSETASGSPATPAPAPAAHRDPLQQRAALADGAAGLVWLFKFLEHRIAGRRILPLIQKWLAAGVIETASGGRPSRGPRKERRSGDMRRTAAAAARRRQAGGRAADAAAGTHRAARGARSSRRSRPGLRDPRTCSRIRSWFDGVVPFRVERVAVEVHGLELGVPLARAAQANCATPSTAPDAAVPARAPARLPSPVSKPKTQRPTPASERRI